MKTHEQLVQQLKHVPEEAFGMLHHVHADVPEHLYPVNKDVNSAQGPSEMFAMAREHVTTIKMDHHAVVQMEKQQSIVLKTYTTKISMNSIL